jgi:hypothetical protein
MARSDNVRPQNSMTLLRELIDIPEQVHRGDFVLRLTEGVTRPTETLRSYVVTDQLRACFDDALAFIRSALESRSSKAAYLHGSFGSGKSHFMAVLHLLLQHNPEARSVAALAPVLARHSAWLDGKRFLLVPYHMIGARSMESAILGGYVKHVTQLHPDAPLPGVYLTEHIFEDARRLREGMGDQAFFDRLNAGKDVGGGGWGAIGAAWDAASFERALRAPAGAEERIRLVGDLVAQIFQAFREVAAASDEAFVTLDDGLAILSKHAQSLGYDAVILFLDELILWLASHVGDMAFLNREGQKLAKLVEATTADRPIPLVSFVARQRDLRELVGEHVPGAERLGFADVLKWWEGRFHKIPLEDRNLPAIAEQRLLRPRDDSARRRIDEAFAETRRVREDVMRVLLTTEADQRMFRAVYPFSPALVQTLVAVSSALQRERTALKVMLQLLVNRRDELALGEVVPVGDLFDVIAEGDEPFNDDMRTNFENAKRLYYQKLLPLIERQHGLRREEAMRLPADDPRARTFRAHDRLLKTLLLAALVPEVESLKAMTAGKLAALNHGTIRSPIPGGEGRMVLGQCRDWAAQIGEIRIGEDDLNPTITIQLSSVDTASILERARGVDNTGNRIVKVRDLLFDQLGLRAEHSLFLRHDLVWRGTKRGVEIVFNNIRDLPDESLRARGSDWKVVIDYPFDADGYTATDDLAKIAEFRQRGEPSRTLCWVPAFLTREALKDLGTLVILDHILAGERFASFALHLSQVDQAAARALLDNQRSQLRQRLRACLDGAYGIATAPPGTVEGSPEVSERLQSLDPGLQPRPPVGADYRAAFEHVTHQLLAHQFPAHPVFETEIRPAALRRVWELAQRAAQAPDGRIIVDRDRRTEMRQIANPLRLGEMHEDAFILGHHWHHHFQRKAGDGTEALTVRRLRQWTDEPTPAGLTKEVQNLLILVFAEQTSHSFFLHRGPFQPSIDNLPDELELRPQRLPARPDWEEAADRAAKILGLTVSPLPTANGVAHLVAEAKRLAAELRGACGTLLRRLTDRMQKLGIATGSGSANRPRTATAALGFLEVIHASSPDGVVSAMVQAAVETSAEAMGTSIKKAAAVCSALETTKFELLEAVGRLTDDRAPRAEEIRRRVVEALERDELALGLEAVLRQAESDAITLLAPPPAPPVPKPPVQPGPKLRVVEQSSAIGLDRTKAGTVLDGLDRKLGENPERRLSIDWRIEEPETGG